MTAMSRDLSVTDDNPSAGLDTTTAADAHPIPPPPGIGGRLLSFPTFLAGSLAYVVFLFSRRNIADPDLWWHLRNAQHLLTTGHLPVVESYSYTAAGAAVLPFEWLSEIPYYLAYKWGGLNTVFLLVFLLCTAISLGVFRLSYVASHDVKNSFLPALGAAVLALVSIGARTLLFGWLYLVILLLILEEVRGGRLKWLWLLPPLFCLWINSHGSWPMGMLVFGIFIASGFVEGSWGQAYATRWSGRQLRALLITAGASAIAVFVNPMGYRLVLFPFKVMFAAGKGVGIIQEFASIDFQTSTGKVAMLVILGTLLVAVLSSERWRLDELAFTILALYYSLTYIRFLFLAGILLAPIFAKRVKVMAPYDKESDKPHYNAIALGILLCLFIVAATRQWKFQNPVKYPDGAIAYMEANGIRGKVFHDWVWGGYLIWRMPEMKVFIDGRGDPYGPVVGDYLSAASTENSQAVLDKYHVEYVLMPADSPLAVSLKSSRAWIVRYSDEDSVLLHRAPTS
jgi:hypothetical protein